MNLNHSQGRKAGSLFLAFLLALSFSMLNMAAVSADSTSPAEKDYSHIFIKNKPDQDLVSKHNEKEKVRLVITLKDDPLLDSPSLKRYSSAKSYLASKASREKESSLLSAQENVEDRIRKEAPDVKFRYHYTSVINGVSAVAKYGDIEDIASVKGVADVFIAQKYRTIDPKLSDSTETIGASAAWDTGYTGKHTVTAILDTGLDLKHEAFQGEVNNPRYDKDDIAKTIADSRLTIGKLSADTVYYSSKIPYQYDYADHDYNVSGGDSHGTHVAGITGANSGGTIKGVAPDTQFFIMKVFGDNSGGAYDDNILAALDDSVKLGCDNINMSLGTSCGFSEDSSTAMRSVYQRVKSAGINLMCAAGNDYSSSYHGNSSADLPAASNPDTSTLSSPSTYSAATSVASVNNSESTDPYFLIGKEKIRYLDSGESEKQMFTSLPAGEYEFIDCGVGKKSDFEGKTLKGKIALIERGGEENGEILTFKEKEAGAVNAGAAAAIIYDNVEGDLVSMATDHAIPIVFISRENGQKMKSSSAKVISVDPEYIGKFKDAYSGRMSDFSSWGVTPDLKLKPEITAPGGSIYSSLPGNKYGNMSGTSMASPHMAGAAAVMEQYVNEMHGGSDLTLAQRTNLVNALMLSTASQVKDEDGNLVSPRKQGAGLVQLRNAMKTGAYLTDKDGGKPVISMGESSAGSFDFSFLLHQLENAGGGSSYSGDYEVSVQPMSERVVEKNGKKYIAQKDRLLKESEITVTAPSKVSSSVSPKQISVGLALTAEGKEKLKSDFPSGIFIEGYVTLTPVNHFSGSGSGESAGTALSLPFMGFFGDWSETPMFDTTIYSGEEAALTPMYLGQFDNRDGGGHILGHNNYGDAKIYDSNKIAVQGGNTGTNITAVSTLFRNASRLEYIAENSSGETVYTESMDNVQKTYYSSGEGFYQPFASNGWRLKDEWNDPLDDGKYTYTVRGYLTSSGGGKADSSADSVTFPVTIDSEKPEIVKSEIKGKKWIVTVRDNHYVQAVGVTTGSTPITGWVNPDEKKEGAETKVTFDLSDPAFKGVSSASIALVDYADNQVVSDAVDLSSGKSDDPDLPDTGLLEDAVKYYRSADGDSDWAKAASYDRNKDQIIDIEDFILMKKNN